MPEDNPIASPPPPTASQRAFDDFYNEVLAPAAPAVAGRRRRCVVLGVAAAAGTFAAMLAALTRYSAIFNAEGVDPRQRNWFAIVLFAVVAAVAAGYFVRARLSQSARGFFREQILRPIANHVDPEMRYVADARMPDAVFEKSLLFDTVSSGRNVYILDGLFSGRGPGGDYAFSALRAEASFRHGCHLRHGLLFSGLFVLLRSVPALDGFVLIAPKYAGLTAEILAARLERQGWNNLVELSRVGDFDFNRLFVAYASHRDRGAAAITPERQKRLVAIHERHGVLPSLSWVGDTLCLALMSDRRHFAEPRNGEALDRARCLEYRDDMALCRELGRDPLWRGSAPL